MAVLPPSGSQGKQCNRLSTVTVKKKQTKKKPLSYHINNLLLVTIAIYIIMF